MKYLILVAFVTTVLFSKSYKEFAQEYRYETSYEKALQRAKSSKRDIFMVQITNYCPWCRKLEKRVLASPEIDAMIHERYIPLIINREEGLLPAQFKTPIVPVTYIINYKDAEDFKSIAGYKSKSDFLHIIQKLK